MSSCTSRSRSTRSWRAATTISWCTGTRTRPICALRVSGVQFPNLEFAIWLFSLFLSALWEEFLFRGLMLSGLAVILRNRWLAAVVMAVFFGLAHAGNPGASALSVMGNALGFPVSGLEMGGLVQQISIGSDLLTGGSYGPEAGLVGMTFRFIAVGLLVGWLKWRGRDANGGE